MNRDDNFATMAASSRQSGVLSVRAVDVESRHRYIRSRLGPTCPRIWPNSMSPTGGSCRLFRNDAQSVAAVAGIVPIAGIVICIRGGG